MLLKPDWVIKFEAELAQAQAARQLGNEGMARVCARRAAGLVSREYLQRQGVPLSGSSAYDHIRSLSILPGLTPEVQEVTGHFLLRITPEHNLPVDADLIAEVVWLKDKLLGGDVA